MADSARQEEMQLWAELWDLLDELYPKGLPSSPGLSGENVAWTAHMPDSRQYPSYTSYLVVEFEHSSREYFGFDMTNGRISNGSMLDKAVTRVREFARNRDHPANAG